MKLICIPYNCKAEQTFKTIVYTHILFALLTILFPDETVSMNLWPEYFHDTLYSFALDDLCILFVKSLLINFVKNLQFPLRHLFAANVPCLRCINIFTTMTAFFKDCLHSKRIASLFTIQP